MCVFCVRIRLFKRLCTMYAALRTSYSLCVQNTSLAPKQDFAYAYDLCALSNLCVQVRLFGRAAYCVHTQLVRSKRLVRTSTDLRVKRLIAYVYGFARKKTYAYEVQL